MKMSHSNKWKTPFNYIVIEDLPIDQQQPFSDWLLGQTTPVIEEEEAIRGKIVLCAYAWDYSMWYNYWVIGEEAKKWQPDSDEINFNDIDENLHKSGTEGPIYGPELPVADQPTPRRGTGLFGD